MRVWPTAKAERQLSSQQKGRNPRSQEAGEPNLPVGPDLGRHFRHNGVSQETRFSPDQG